MKSIFPILAQNFPVGQQSLYAVNDHSVLSNLSPTVNAWDSTSNPMGFTINVPQSERWLVNFSLEAWIQGNAAPTYQIGFGLVLKGATRLEPPHPNSPSPWNYHLGISASGDQAWGSFSVPVWLNPGATMCYFAYGRDSGAISLQNRHMAAVPILGMKI